MARSVFIPSQLGTRMLTNCYTIAEIANIAGATISGDSAAEITGVAPIACANKGDLTYLVGGKYQKFLRNTNATAVILSEKYVKQCPVIALIVANPEASFARVAQLFNKQKKPKSGVHTSAVVGIGCNIDPSVSVGPGCIIEDGVTIGRSTVIMGGTVIGSGTQIGENCILYSRVAVYYNSVIGNRVVLHSGVVIGADGFGFAQENGQWTKIPQLGRVIIEDDVEIGANSTVDRGTLGDTMIRQGVKIDDLVLIAHNVEIGDHTIIAGCTGIGGSAKIGRHCMIGGACNINGHNTIVDGVIIAGASTVAGSINESGVYSSGFKEQPHQKWRRIIARVMQINEMEKRIKKLERLCNDSDQS